MVLILVDALRRDHLPCYGYERPTAPFLSGAGPPRDRLRERLFDDLVDRPRHGRAVHLALPASAWPRHRPHGGRAPDGTGRCPEAEPHPELCRNHRRGPEGRRLCHLGRGGERQPVPRDGFRPGLRRVSFTAPLARRRLDLEEAGGAASAHSREASLLPVPALHGRARTLRGTPSVLGSETRRRRAPDRGLRQRYPLSRRPSSRDASRASAGSGAPWWR